MAEVIVERLRAAGGEIDDPERWTVKAAHDVGDGPNAGPGPLTLEVDAWIGAVRRRPAGRPPPTGRAVQPGQFWPPKHGNPDHNATI